MTKTLAEIEREVKELKTTALFLAIMVAGLAGRLWHDEVRIRRQQEINLIQQSWNQAVKADDARLRREYSYMWKDQQKCHPILGAQGRDVFCHGLKCWYLKNTEVEADQ